MSHSFYGLLKQFLISSTEDIHNARMEVREKYPDMFNTSEKSMIEDGDCEVLKWWEDKSWWDKMDLALENCSVNETNTALLELIAESRRRARLEMAREMKNYVLNAKDSHMSQVVIFALIQEKFDSIIQEEENKK